MRSAVVLNLLLMVLMALLPTSATAAEPVGQQAVIWEDQQRFLGRNARPDDPASLRILSSTDTSFFQPLLEQFLALYPQWSVDYRVAGSTTVHDVFLENRASHDVVISSAMDLQLKLVNDGHAMRVDDIDHPEWAQWRHSLFGFTQEPASFIINRQAFADLPVPRTRLGMIQVLRDNAERFRGRLGTYDIRESGLGYLFATQDARRSETYWRLMEIMGSLRTQLYCCSGEMIDDVVSGKLAVGYNVLSSYAAAQPALADRIDIIYPSDFPITMMRTAFVSRDTPHREAAVTLLRFLAASRWTAPDPNSVTLPALPENPDWSGKSVIDLEPGLLVFQDQLKRRAFLRAWENAIIR